MDELEKLTATLALANRRVQTGESLADVESDLRAQTPFGSIEALKSAIRLRQAEPARGGGFVESLMKGLGEGREDVVQAASAVAGQGYPNPAREDRDTFQPMNLAAQLARGAGQMLPAAAAGAGAAMGTAAALPASAPSLLAALAAGGASGAAGSAVQGGSEDLSDVLRRAALGAGEGAVMDGLLLGAGRGYNLMRSRVAPGNMVPRGMPTGGDRDAIGAAIQAPFVETRDRLMGEVDEMYNLARALPGSQEVIDTQALGRSARAAAVEAPGAGLSAGDIPPAINTELDRILPSASVERVLTARRGINARLRDTARSAQATSRSQERAMITLKRMVDDVLDARRTSGAVRLRENPSLDMTREANAFRRRIAEQFDDSRLVSRLVDSDTSAASAVSAIKSATTPSDELAHARDVLLANGQEQGWENIRRAFVDHLDDVAMGRNDVFDERRLRGAIQTIGRDKIDILFPDVGFDGLVEALGTSRAREMVRGAAAGRFPFGAAISDVLVGQPSLNRMVTHSAGQKAVDSMFRLPGRAVVPGAATGTFAGLLNR